MARGRLGRGRTDLEVVPDGPEGPVELVDLADDNRTGAEVLAHGDPFPPPRESRDRPRGADLDEPTGRQVGAARSLDREAGSAPVERPVRDPSAPGYVVGTALTLISVIMLMFVSDLLVVGHIKHARDQRTAFADLRADLANGTTPVNQTDASGRLLPLGTALGVLEIPQIGLREVFFEGTTSGVLLSGPGHRRDTAMPGQAGTSVIMGRKAAFGGPFTFLSELQPQMVFWVWTGQGRAGYRVSDIRHSGDPQPAALGAGQGRLTLVSAEGTDYVPSDVVRVDASLVTAAQPAGPRPLTALNLPINERPMRGDAGAWVSVVIWAALLALLSFTTMWVRLRWGRWQTWLAAAPLLLAVGLAVSENVVRLLPNLL